MNDFRGKTKGEDAGSAKKGISLSSAESMQLLRVIIALDRIRMNIGMYPTGHSQITESIDHAFDIIQKILREKSDLLIGFAGDKTTFGETLTDKEKMNASFRDYSRSLNNLRIVSFTLHRGLKKEDLMNFSRILSAKPEDIWAQGKIGSVFAGAGITGIKVKVIDADHFSLEKKKEIIQPRVVEKSKDVNFWQEFFDRLQEEAQKLSQNDGIPKDQVKIDPAEAVRFLNKQRENWPSAVFSYEKMIRDYFSQITKGRQSGAEKNDTLTSVNSLVGNIHPELKIKLINVVERQLILYPETARDSRIMKNFPRDMLLEIIRHTYKGGAQISPTLINLLKKMTDIQEAPASPDLVKDEDFSYKDMETLLQREQYEKYVPQEYDRLLKKATDKSVFDKDHDESAFPVQEYLPTLAAEYVDIRICLLIHSIMDQEIAEEDYLACSRKLMKSIPELLKAGQFAFLITVMETLRRHSQEKPSETIRQKALSILQSLSEKEIIAKSVSPIILQETYDPTLLTKFLISSGVQNLLWLFDLYLNPKVPLLKTITLIMKGFGRNATEEALKRLPKQDSPTIIRLLMFIREMDDRSVASSLTNLFDHENWAVKREIINTLIQFADPAVIELLRSSLQAENQAVVLEAVGLACRYRVGDLLPDLTSLIKTIIIREEDAILNEWIVGELAKSGHPAVIPYLERIVTTWFSLSPKYLSRTKVALYRNLQHFPKNQILKLLQKGNKSRNEEIRTLAAKILNSKE